MGLCYSVNKEVFPFSISRTLKPICLSIFSTRQTEQRKLLALPEPAPWFAEAYWSLAGQAILSQGPAALLSHYPPARASPSKSITIPEPAFSRGTQSLSPFLQLRGGKWRQQPGLAEAMGWAGLPQQHVALGMPNQLTVTPRAPGCVSQPAAPSQGPHSDRVKRKNSHPDQV